jgi:hypothetical protein
MIVFENAPGKGGYGKFPEKDSGGFTPKVPLSMIGGGGPVARTLAVISVDFKV